MGVSCKRLGLEMMNWHSSGGDPIYAAGSHLNAGMPISRELANKAADALARNLPGAKARMFGWTAKDERSLKSMIRQLRKGSCT